MLMLEKCAKDNSMMPDNFFTPTAARNTPIAYTETRTENASNSSHDLFLDTYRSEIIHLITGALCSLNLPNSAAAVMMELRDQDASSSKPRTEFDSDKRVFFERAILDGDWDQADSFLSPRIQERADTQTIRYLIRRQQYLECIHHSHQLEGLHVLERYLRPLSPHVMMSEITSFWCGTGSRTERSNNHSAPEHEVENAVEDLHFLSTLLLRCAPLPMRGPSRSGFSFSMTAPIDRSHFLGKLEQYLHQNWGAVDMGTLFPTNANVRLVDILREHVRQHCPYHSPDDPQSPCLSLLYGRPCFKSARIPTRALCTVHHHTSEVWHVTFSSCGHFIATGSRDGTCWVYRLARSTLQDTNWTLVPFAHCRNSETDAGIDRRGHQGPIVKCVFDPFPGDHTGVLRLLTCSEDTRVLLWDIKVGGVKEPAPHSVYTFGCSGSNGTAEHVGKVQRCFSGHSEAVNAIAWISSPLSASSPSRSFLSASNDLYVIRWDADTGAILQRWYGARVYDLAVTFDGHHFLTIDSEKRLLLYTFTSEPQDFMHAVHHAEIQESHASQRLSEGNKTDIEAAPISQSAHVPILLDQCSTSIVSLFASQNGNYCVTLQQPSEDHSRCLLPSCCEKGVMLLHRFTAQGRAAAPQHYPAVSASQCTQGWSGQYVTHGTFGGGTADCFMACGTDDGNVLIYHREQGTLLAKLGLSHPLPNQSSKRINAVAWNPGYPGLLASVSDDGTTTIWGTAGASVVAWE